MSKIALSPDDSGTGTFTLASPNGNTNRTLTLPDAAGELLTTTGDGSGLTGIVIPPVFKPVAVTGTTPSLDVGTYNYFDNGTLSGDTTVSFASVPTEANWRYSFVPTTLNAWDVSTASYLQAFPVAAQDTTPYGVFFKPDGLKMYVLGDGGNDINEYDLSTAWDISTASYSQAFFVGYQDSIPTDLFFKPDGTQMYVTGAAGQDINEYALSTAWDISTASFTRVFNSSAQDAYPAGISFKPDGLKMYMLGANNGFIEYDLSTAWNISTAVFLQAFSVSAQDTNSRGSFFKDDGTKMYHCGTNSGSIYEYELSTAWDISTASYSQAFSVATKEADPFGLFFRPDGTKFYVIGPWSDKVHEYNAGTPTAVTLPAAVVGTPSATSVGDRVTYEFVTLDGGTTVNLIAEKVIAP